MKPTPLERFYAKVDQNGPNGCWIWKGSLNKGYGRFNVNRRGVIAHRFIYEQIHGAIPDGLYLDHFVCDNGPGGCVNPDHVRPVSPRENSLRSNGITALCRARTHCPSGHPYDEANTLLSQAGKRYCRLCRKAADQKRTQTTKYKARRAAYMREWNRRKREAS